MEKKDSILTGAPPEHFLSPFLSELGLTMKQSWRKLTYVARKKFVSPNLFQEEVDLDRALVIVFC